MSNLRLNKAQKHMLREAGNRFLSVLLTLAMVTQSTPVAAYGEMLSEGQDAPEQTVVAPEADVATTPSVEQGEAPVASEPVQTEDVVVSEAPTYDEAAPAEPAPSDVIATDGVTVSEATPVVEDVAQAMLTVAVENATLTAGGEVFTNTTGTITTPAGQALNFVVAAAAGYELSDGSVTVTVDGNEVALAANADGSYTVGEADVKTGTRISVKPAKTPVERVYTYDDASMTVTATLDEAVAIPDDAVLSVKSITAATSEQLGQYNYAAYLEALNKSAAAPADQPVYTDENTLLYDVEFTWTDSKTGERHELQPAKGGMNLKFHFKQRQISRVLGAPQAADAVLTQLQLADGVKGETTAATTNITADDVTVSQLASVGKGHNTIEARTQSASAFAVSYTKAGEDEAAAETTDAEATTEETTEATTEETAEEDATTEDVKRVYTYDDDALTVTATLDEASAIPDDAILQVKGVTAGQGQYNYAAYMEALNNAAGAGADQPVYTDENTLLYDVAFLWTDPLTDKTIELQPKEGSVTVKMHFKQRQISRGLGAEQAADVEVIHLPLAGRAKAATTAEATGIGANDVVVEDLSGTQRGIGHNTVEVVTDNFSVIAVAYTVDFTYGGYQLKLDGSGSIKLSQVLEALHIDESAADVANATFTNDAVLSVAAIDGDWLLTSLQSFETPETLTLEMADGRTTYEIAVTDPPEPPAPSVPQTRTSSNLADFTVNVTVSGATQQGGAYVVEKDVPYGVNLTFNESHGLQFDNHATLTYDIPTGMYIPENQTSPMTVNIVSGGRTYRVAATLNVTTDGKLSIKFDESDPNFPRLVNTRNVSLRAQFNAAFNGESEKINFGNGVEKDIKIDNTDHSDAFAAKEGSFDAATGTYTYTIRVTANGNPKNVNVKDLITGTALNFNNDIRVTGNSSSYTTNSLGNGERGFDYTFAEMQDGEEIVITYSASLDQTKMVGASSITPDMTKNTVTVTKEGGNPHSAEYSHQLELKKPNKSDGVEAGTDASGNKIYDWKVVYNETLLAPAAGDTIKDTIAASSQDLMKYYGDVTVTVYDRSGQQVGSPRTFTPGSDSAWTYTVPDGDTTPYKYEFTYQTIVDQEKVNGLPDATELKNTSEGPDGLNDTGVIGVGPKEATTIDKQVVTYDENEVTWVSNIHVPENGLATAVVEDTLPGDWIDGAAGIDTFKEGSLVVEGLKDGESYSDPVITNGGDNKQHVTITFYQDQAHTKTGLKGFTGGHDITITLTSKVDQRWLEAAYRLAEDPNQKNFLTHKNTITINGKPATAEVTYSKPGIQKLGEETRFTEADGTAHENAYLYEVILSDVSTEPVTVEDVFDTDVVQLAPYAADNRNLTVAGGNQYAQDSEKYPVNYSETDGGVLLTVDNFPKQANGKFYPYYKISYFVELKEGIDLEELAAENGGTYDLINEAVWGDHRASKKFTYTYDKLTKELLTKATDEDRIATYRVTFNPKKATLNNGESITLTDTMNKYISLDYSSVKITTDPPNQNVTYTFSGERDEHNQETGGTVGTYTIPDETAVTIEYSVNVRGNGTFEYKNVVTAAGETEDAKDTVTMESSGDGSGIQPSIKAVKVDGYDGSVKLAHVPFRLYSKNGVSLYDEDSPNYGVTETTVETNENGEIDISYENGGFSLEFGQTYYLEELQAPDGYQKLSFPYEFTLTYNPDDLIAGQYIYMYGESFQIKEWPLEGLIVEKIVDSEDADAKNAEYGFKIEILDGSGNVDTSVNTTYGEDLEFTNGVAAFTLHNGEQMVAWDMPAGTKFRVTETDANDMVVWVGEGGTSAKSEDGSYEGVVVGEGSYTLVTFTNKDQENGSLKLTKQIKEITPDNQAGTVISEARSAATLGDGTYSFTITGPSEETDASKQVTKYAQITVTNGVVASAKVGDSATSLTDATLDADKFVEVKNLAAGTYRVTETTPTNGTEIDGNAYADVTVVAGKDGANVAATGKATITNKYETTTVEGEKVWYESDGTTKKASWPSDVTSVSVKLQKSTDGTTWDDVEGKAKTLTSADATYKFENLPTKEYVGSGNTGELKDVSYKVVETGTVPESIPFTVVAGSGAKDANGKYNISNKEETGSLKLRKQVKINDTLIESKQSAATLADGDYVFTIKAVDGNGTPLSGTAAVTKNVTITIDKGVATSASGDGTLGNDGFVEISDLKAGTYQITETDPNNGTVVDGDNPVTVTVEAGKTADAAANAKATIVNKLEFGGIKVTKAITENGGAISEAVEGQLPKTFSYTLYTTEDCAVGDEYKVDGRAVTTTVTIEKDGKAKTSDEIGNLPVGTYWLKETVQSSDLFAPSQNPVPVTVEAGKTGTTAKNVDFTNDYKSATAQLGAKKAANQNLGDKTFQFELLDADGTVVETSAAVSQGAGVEFEEFAYDLSDAGKTFDYQIRELIPANAEAYDKTSGKKVDPAVTYTDGARDTYTWKKDGVTYDAHVESVTIAVTKDADSNLSVTYNNATTFTTPSFNNTYGAEGSAIFSAEKKADDSLAGKTFSFELLDADNNDAVLKTVDNVAAGSKGTFEAITYQLADAGKTFNYKIREFIPADAKAYDKTTGEKIDPAVTYTDGIRGDYTWKKDGVTYDAHVEDVAVAVTNGGDGSLTVTYDGEATFTTPTFTNSYQASGTGEILVQKILNGRNWTNTDTFTFTLAPNGSAPMPDDDEITIAKADKDQPKSFGDIAFTAAGTYRYVVKETKGSIGGIAYDTKDHPVTIKVVDKGDGSLVADVDSSLIQTVTITNEYTSSGNTKLEVQKLITNGTWPKKADGTPAEATFTLTGAGDAPMPAEAGRTVTLTKANTIATFGEIPFAKKDVGKTYTYTISETSDWSSYAKDAAKWQKSADITATVEVSDNGGGTIVGKVTYNPTTKAITNTYTPDKPEFNKKVKDTNDSTGDTSDWQDSADYDIGDDVPFRLQATLAQDVSSYKAYYLKFTDQMEAGLTYKGVTSVTVGGKELDSELYKVKSTDAQNFTVEITWTGANGGTIDDTSLDGAEVCVYFDATLNSSATLGKPGNVNGAKLTYSNKPDSDQPTKDVDEKPWDYAIVFTYKVDVNKVDPDGTALKGAEFTLEKLIKGADGVKDSWAGVTLDAKDNVFTATGLDDGTYKLTETKAPTGFQKISPITFVVKAGHITTWDYRTPAADGFAPDGDGRAKLLETLTGTTTTGALTLSADKKLEGLAGNVENQEQGALTISKSVKFNGEQPKDENKKIADGTYYFTVKDAKGTVVAERSITITDGASNTAVVNNLDPGMYTVSEDTAKSTNKDVILLGNNDQKVTVSADATATAATASFVNSKPGTPEFNKKIKDTNDSTGDTSDWQDSADYDIGDDVPFRLQAKLANDVTDYKQYYVKFTDQMEDGLTFNEGSVEVYVAGKKLKASDYKLTESAEHAFGLEITWGDNKSLITDTTLNNALVEVYFTAELNSKAAIGNKGNINGAKLTYSNNPNSEQPTQDTEDKPWDYVIAFTYQLDIAKLDQDNNALEGAAFKLEKRLANGTTKEIPLSVTRNLFTSVGLDDGTYKLTEIKAPKGYRAIDPIEFTVTADHELVWDYTSADVDFDLSGDHGRLAILTDLTGSTESGDLTVTENDELKVTGNVINQGEGSLKITKNVTVNGSPAEGDNLNVADGDYSFTVTGPNNYKKDVTITITNGESNSVTVGNLLPGTYTVTENAPTNGTYLVGANAKTVEVTALNETSVPTAAFTNNKPGDSEFNKKIKDVNDSTREESPWQDSADYDIGDAVPYRLQAKLANDVSTYKKYYVKFTDQMEPGLAFKEVTRVTVAGQELTDADYTLTPIDDQNFTLEITWGEGQSLAIDESLNGANVNVFFDATLTEDAVIGGKGNVNAGKLTYSNKPDSEQPEKDTKDTEWDYVIVFTYQTDLSKVDQDGAALEGAEFKLEKLIKGADGAEDSWKELALTVDGNVFTGVGLDDGIYKLTETAAPKGYKAIDPITFEVSAEHVTEWKYRSDSYNPSPAEASIERTGILTSLTGDTTSGSLTMTDNDDFIVTGDVTNEFSVTAKVEFDKYFYGAAAKDFTFKMTPADEGFAPVADTVAAQPDDEGNFPYGEKHHFLVTQEVNPDGEAEKIALPVTFFKPGTYRYLVEEVATDEAVFYDESKIGVTITVEKGSNDAKVEYTVLDANGEEIADAEAAFYNNETVVLDFRSTALKQQLGILRETAFEPEIRKVLVNGTLTADQFTFAIYEGTDTTGAPLATETNDELGNVAFPAIAYDHVPEGGSQTFTIVEVPGTDPSIVYSDEPITLTVTVEEEQLDENTSRLVATGVYTWKDNEGAEHSYSTTDVAGDEGTIDLPTIYNEYDEIEIHAVKRERTYDAKGNMKLGEAVPGATYELYMVNPNGADIKLGECVSDAKGNLTYKIPPTEGVVYYFLEAGPAPEGHLIDPYPTDYFTLVNMGEGFALRYESQFDGDTDAFVEAVMSGNVA